MSIPVLIRVLTKKIQWRIYIKYEMLINSIVLVGNICQIIGWHPKNMNPLPLADRGWSWCRR